MFYVYRTVAAAVSFRLNSFLPLLSFRVSPFFSFSFIWFCLTIFLLTWLQFQAVVLFSSHEFQKSRINFSFSPEMERLFFSSKRQFSGGLV